MKLADLDVIFSREWENGGLVESVRLPAADLSDLAAEALAGPGAEIALNPGVTPEMVCGARVSHLVNRAAGNTVVAVDLAPEGESATAVVRYGPDGSQARTVAVA